MKKRILKRIMVAVIILLIITAGLLLAYKAGWFYRADGQQIRFMTEINEANSIIWYYGDLDPGKEVTINYKKVDEFTEETIGDSDNQYVYHAIVIFDFDGKMDISNDELLLIKDYCENRHYDMLYYGTAHIKQFQGCGFLSEMYAGDCGFTYNGSYWMNRAGKEENIESYFLSGIWTESDSGYFDVTDNHYMWKFAIDYIAQLITDSNGEL